MQMRPKRRKTMGNSEIPLTILTLSWVKHARLVTLSFWMKKECASFTTNLSIPGKIWCGSNRFISFWKASGIRPWLKSWKSTPFKFSLKAMDRRRFLKLVCSAKNTAYDTSIQIATSATCQTKLVHVSVVCFVYVSVFFLIHAPVAFLVHFLVVCFVHVYVFCFLHVFVVCSMHVLVVCFVHAHVVCSVHVSVVCSVHVLVVCSVRVFLFVSYTFLFFAWYMCMLLVSCMSVLFFSCNPLLFFSCMSTLLLKRPVVYYDGLEGYVYFTHGVFTFIYSSYPVVVLNKGVTSFQMKSPQMMIPRMMRTPRKKWSSLTLQGKNLRDSLDRGVYLRGCRGCHVHKWSQEVVVGEKKFYRHATRCAPRFEPGYGPYWTGLKLEFQLNLVPGMV